MQRGESQGPQKTAKKAEHTKTASASKGVTFFNIPDLGRKPFKRIKPEDVLVILESKYSSKRSTGIIVIKSEEYGFSKINIHKGEIVQCSINDKPLPLAKKLKTEGLISHKTFSEIKDEDVETLGETLAESDLAKDERFESLKRHNLISTVSEVIRWSLKEPEEVGVFFWSWYEKKSTKDFGSVWDCYDLPRKTLFSGVIERVGQWSIMEKNFPYVCSLDSVPKRGEFWDSIKDNTELNTGYRNVIKKINNKNTIRSIVNMTGLTQFEVSSALVRGQADGAAFFTENNTVESGNEHFDFETDEYNFDEKELENFTPVEENRSDIVKNYTKLKNSVKGGEKNIAVSFEKLKLDERRKSEVSELFAKAQNQFSEVEELINSQGTEMLIGFLNEKNKPVFEETRSERDDFSWEDKHHQGQHPNTPFNQNQIYAPETDLSEEDIIHMGLGSEYYHNKTSHGNGTEEDFNEFDLDESEHSVQADNIRKWAGQDIRTEKRRARGGRPQSGRGKDSGILDDDNETINILSAFSGESEPKISLEMFKVLNRLKEVVEETLPALLLEKQELEKALIYQAHISSVLIARLDQIDKAIKKLKQ